MCVVRCTLNHNEPSHTPTTTTIHTHTNHTPPTHPPTTPPQTRFEGNKAAARDGGAVFSLDTNTKVGKGRVWNVGWHVG